MLFNSLHYLIFLPLVLLLHWMSPRGFRVALLLLASCYFYMAFIPKFILILFALILVDFAAGIWIEKSEGNQKKFALVFSLCANLGILFFFKYYNFFASNLPLSLPILKVVLPIGLSFHTFQSMAYVIEVYRGKVPAERNLAVYALYVLFFPQMVAGPIERPGNLLPQFHSMKPSLSESEVVVGLRYILWGLFKKMMIADRLTLFVDPVYTSPSEHSGIAFCLATFFFAFQIYCDFSGYSDIAIGSARLFGIRLMRNFDTPYASASFSEFWKRWHISLSSWFRDYVYIPLGGNRSSFGWQCFSLFVVFALSGFWHGANWTFLVWGLLNGAYLIIEKGIGFQKIKMPKFVAQTLVFLFISYTWIFFRANSLKDSFYIVARLFSGEFSGASLSTALKTVGWSVNQLGVALLLIVFLVLSESRALQRNVPESLARLPRVVRWGAYAGLVLLILNYSPYVTVPFIYFQF